MSMDLTAVAGTGAPHAVSGASQGAPPQQKMTNLFDSIDTSGSGSITKAQFEQAFQSKNPPGVFKSQGADAIFAALDPTGSGSVSKADFVSGMTKLMSSLRGHHHGHRAAPPSGESAAASVQALSQIGATTPAPTAAANASTGTQLDLKA